MEGGRAAAVAPSYIGLSIFNLLCCCLPLGIAALIYSCKAQEANSLGQTSLAQDASRTAKILNIVGIVCGILLIIIFIAVNASSSPQ
ncbi:transmembrane protein 91-like [Xyrichtys novacula]|uniref:Transmembrane protein 91-like n=1 Tax=Xyrichtys novacula TaxID=13765 RepID=A0AAV1FWN2_XYRNO|nr:transmembrane protein 91-like [Xyrichtys novacula]